MERKYLNEEKKMYNLRSDHLCTKSCIYLQSLALFSILQSRQNALNYWIANCLKVIQLDITANLIDGGWDRFFLLKGLCLFLFNIFIISI